MERQEIRERLMDLVDGTLPAEEAHRVEEAIGRFPDLEQELNDLREAVALAGKLSDVAGLIAFPLVLAWTGEILSGRRVGPRAVAVCAVATALVFAATNIWSPARAVYEHFIGPMTMDATDLWTLPAALVPIWAVTGRTAVSSEAGARLPGRRSVRRPMPAPQGREAVVPCCPSAS